MIFLIYNVILIAKFIAKFPVVWYNETMMPVSCDSFKRTA